MAFLEVHENPNARTNAAVPYLLDVQSDLLASLESRVVIPLYRQEAAPGRPMARLTPLLEFQGQAYIAMVPELAGVRRRELGALAGSLASARTEIIGALDFLFTGI